MKRRMTPTTWDERATLTTLLDFARATVHAKCEGLSEQCARQAPLPGSPLVTISGLISHLRWVEYAWFDVTFLDEEDLVPWTEDDPDRDMRIATSIPLEQLLSDYEAGCARHRELVATTALDALAVGGKVGPRKEPPTLRWIILHLLEETARHNGHIDILREMADGVTGM